MVESLQKLFEVIMYFLSSGIIIWLIKGFFSRRTEREMLRMELEKYLEILKNDSLAKLPNLLDINGYTKTLSHLNEELRYEILNLNSKIINRNKKLHELDKHPNLKIYGAPSSKERLIAEMPELTEEIKSELTNIIISLKKVGWCARGKPTIRKVA